MEIIKAFRVNVNSLNQYFPTEDDARKYLMNNEAKKYSTNNKVIPVPIIKMDENYYSLGSEEPIYHKYVHF